MKVITSVQGSVAVRYSPDDAAPEPGVLSRDAVAFLGATYSFSSVPQVPPGLMINPGFTFQAGEYSGENGKHPVIQVAWSPQAGSLVVTAKDTSIADIILMDIAKNLNEQLNYKIEASAAQKYFQSNLVVEFGSPLEKQIGLFNRIQQLLEKEIPRKNQTFAIKRLVFGNLAMEQRGGVPIAVDDLQDIDFVIERRATEPLSANRFFCMAPLSTPDHERVLQAVERVLLD